MQKWFGKNGVVLWRYANGLDCSRIMHTEYESPMKSVGHGITCSCDLTSNNDVYCHLTQNTVCPLIPHACNPPGTPV